MLKKLLYNYFHIDKHNSSIKTEVLAGITNFFTIIYLVILVPEIIMGAFPGAIDVNGELIGDFLIAGKITANEMLIALTASAFAAAGIGTILMGVFVNLPFVQGPSLAIGTFITYTVCKNFGYTYNQALALVFISGLCFFIMSVFGIEKKINKVIPVNIKFAVTAGIGLFIAFAGIQKAHIIDFKSDSMVNLFNITDISSIYTKDALLALFGVILIVVLLKKHVHGAIFIGKIVCIILAFPLGLIKSINIEKFSYNIPFSEIVFKIDFSGLFGADSSNSLFKTMVTILIILFSICIMNIFETMSMLIVRDSLASISKGEIKVKRRLLKILEIDAVTTSIGAALGSTTVSTYVESTAGMVEGGRTGFTSVVTGILFLCSVFITPVVSIIPSAATATTLIIAGILMMNVIKYIDFEDPAESVPAFLTMFMMPITNSLIVGIAFGVISYLIIHVCIGEGKKINYLMYILAALFLITVLFIPR